MYSCTHHKVHIRQSGFRESKQHCHPSGLWHTANVVPNSYSCTYHMISSNPGFWQSTDIVTNPGLWQTCSIVTNMYICTHHMISANPGFWQAINIVTNPGFLQTYNIVTNMFMWTHHKVHTRQSGFFGKRPTLSPIRGFCRLITLSPTCIYGHVIRCIPANPGFLASNQHCHQLVQLDTSHETRQSGFLASNQNCHQPGFLVHLQHYHIHVQLYTSHDTRQSGFLSNNQHSY